MDKPDPALDSRTLQQDPRKWTDRLAREGDQPHQEDRCTSSVAENNGSKQHPNFNQSNSFHILNRSEQVILFRLRTGHNRLYAHMYSKSTAGESVMCPCNAGITTAKNLLQRCQLHDALRWDMWQEPIPLRDKLYGNVGELRGMAP